MTVYWNRIEPTPLACKKLAEIDNKKYGHEPEKHICYQVERPTNQEKHEEGSQIVLIADKPQVSASLVS